MDNRNGSGLREEVIQKTEVQPIQVILSGCSCRVDPLPDGGKQLALIHPSGHVYVIPLPAAAAREIATALASGLEIAGVVP